LIIHTKDFELNKFISEVFSKCQSFCRQLPNCCRIYK